MPPSTDGPSGSQSPIDRTKILLLGQRRSGKTSIVQVLFNDGNPKETFYLEPTTRIAKFTYDTVIPLEIWDCPGNISLDALSPLSQFASIIFVIDIQDSYQTPIARLLEFFTAAFGENPDMPLEVFVHKSEAFTDDYKIENFRLIHLRVNEELDDISPEYEQMPLNFHLTSIYDHSINEAFSKVLHRLIDSLPYLEQLLNVFVANSQASKTFLFDVKSRLYVATDASPVDTGTHNLCCDFVKTLTAFGPLYKSVSESPRRIQECPNSKPLFYPSAAMSLAPPSMGTTLTYHLITPQLALLSVLPTLVYESKRGLVEYNVVFFREGVQEIWQVEKDARTGQL
ncbi:Gtr1/RagA G protein Gtr2 [Dentipellis sp. KUC8613]|nr:Gtr1/RagA G protein Gtr2 [Dentipellis sp. KUC8613]